MYHYVAMDDGNSVTNFLLHTFAIHQLWFKTWNVWHRNPRGKTVPLLQSYGQHLPKKYVLFAQVITIMVLFTHH